MMSPSSRSPMRAVLLTGVMVLCSNCSTSTPIVVSSSSPRLGSHAK